MITINDIKPGMFGFSGVGTWIQRAIRFFINGDFSHSFPVIDGPYRIVSAFETTDTIVRCIEITKKLEEPDWVQIWEPIASQEAKDAAAADVYREYTGVWYGFPSYIWFMYRWVMRQFGKEPTQVWDWASKGVTCTELTCYYLMRLGPDFSVLFAGKDFSAQSPQELVNIVKANPDLFNMVGWLKEKS